MSLCRIERDEDRRVGIKEKVRSRAQASVDDLCILRLDWGLDSDKSLYY